MKAFRLLLIKLQPASTVNLLVLLLPGHVGLSEIFREGGRAGGELMALSPPGNKAQGTAGVSSLGL